MGMQPKPKLTIIFLGIFLLLATLLRLPFVYEGSPYFYREDEAHHFNRTINMMKSGNLDPDYFHKPSLHFYLRLPVAAIGFLYSVKKTEIKEVKEIITSDPFGVADYAFSASHPRILHISRAFSLLLSLLTIVLTFSICQQLQLGRLAGLGAAALLAFSPAAIEESAVIGVDGPMTFFAVWATYLGIRAYKLKSHSALFWCAAVCGLCVSCKYNAFPVFIIPPLILLFNRSYDLGRCLTAFFIAPVFFLIGSPYILFSIPKFLNQFGYEIWHYGVAGHIGHTAKPGLEQLLFYLSWLANDAIGLLALLLAVCGSILLLKVTNESLRLAAVFPILFFCLMLAQKANFERNMIVIIPFACILGASVLSFPKAKAIFRILFIISLVQPLIGAINISTSTSALPESRLLLSQKAAGITDKTVAVDGLLQVERKILDLPGFDRINFADSSPQSLYQSGYRTLIVSAENASRFQKFELYKETELIAGNPEKQRTVQNPEIHILTASSELSEAQISILQPSSQKQTINIDNPDYSTEGMIWINSSLSEITFNSNQNFRSLKLKLFSPWENQVLQIRAGNNSQTASFENNKETEIVLENGESSSLEVLSSKVLSPLSMGLSSDNRKLAFAIKSIEVIK